MEKFSIELTFRSDLQLAIEKMGRVRRKNLRPRRDPRFERESRHDWAEANRGIEHPISIAWLFIDHAVRFDSLHANASIALPSELSALKNKESSQEDVIHQLNIDQPHDIFFI